MEQEQEKPEATEGIRDKRESRGRERGTEKRAKSRKCPGRFNKKTVKKRVLKKLYIGWFFLFFGLWTPELSILSLKFGFYVKFPP